MHTASRVAMVRPAAFGYNKETAENNFFQQVNDGSDLQEKALQEFDAMVALLQDHGIDVLVLNDRTDTIKPDAVFPNNWFSCMDNCITLFPMCAMNRRAERNPDIIAALQKKTGISLVRDISHSEKDNRFLEGTGSMVIDHRNRIIYACLSARTDKGLLESFAKSNDYSLSAFEATDEHGREIYHTNVMLCIADAFAVVCADAINEKDCERVLQNLSDTGHEIISISFEQMNAFAGNMLQLQNRYGEKFLVMSSTAYNSLSDEQIKKLRSFSTLITPEISTIERAGGGSVRCMMTELFY